MMKVIPESRRVH